MTRSQTAWMIVGEDGLFIRHGDTEVEAIARHVFAMRLPGDPEVPSWLYDKHLNAAHTIVWERLKRRGHRAVEVTLTWEDPEQ